MVLGKLFGRKDVREEDRFGTCKFSIKPYFCESPDARQAVAALPTGSSYLGTTTLKLPGGISYCEGCKFYEKKDGKN